MKKIISFLLAALLLVSAVPMAHATNDYTAGTKVEYTAANTEAYTITVPAQLAPGGSGTVTLEGTWASDRVVSVTADKNVKLTNSINAADQKTLNVSFPGIAEYGSNTTSQKFTETVSVEGITDALFGTWSGRFYYNVNAYDSVEYLQSKYDFEYYSTMNLAVTDVNNGAVGASADIAEADKDTAVAGVYTDENGGVNVVLLQDYTEATTISPAVDMTINLGGHTLSASDESVIYVTSGNVTIDGRLSGSTVQNNYDSASIIQCIKAAGTSNVTIQNGTYIISAAEDGSSQGRSIFVTDTANLTISDASLFSTSTNTRADGITIDSNAVAALSNCTVVANDKADGKALAIFNKGNATISNCSITATSNGYAYGMYNGGTAFISDCTLNSKSSASVAVGVDVRASKTANFSNCTINVTSNNSAIGVNVLSSATVSLSDCLINVTAPSGMPGYGVQNQGALTLTNCTIKAYSNYNSDGNGNYSAYSYGLKNYGTATLNNCTIRGILTGVSNNGTLYVNGGTYEGYGHGGFYFGGAGTTAYVRNATIKECAMPDGYTDFRPGCNGSGFYIGGGTGEDNITVYMDNCDIYGSRQPIVLRGTSGEQNNTLYISNSRINMDYTVNGVRIDNDTHKLFIGAGNNFTADNTNRPSAVITTDETYIMN